MEHKVITPQRLKVSASGNGTLTGYASTWEKDRIGDIVLPGAFKDRGFLLNASKRTIVAAQQSNSPRYLSQKVYISRMVPQ